MAYKKIFSYLLIILTFFSLGFMVQAQSANPPSNYYDTVANYLCLLKGEKSENCLVTPTPQATQAPTGAISGGTNPPPAGSLTTEDSLYGRNLLNALRAACGNTINGHCDPNAQPPCLDRVVAPPGGSWPAAKGEILNGIRSTCTGPNNSPLQCIAWTSAVSRALGGSTHLGAGNARDKCSSVPAGYQVIRVTSGSRPAPQAGDFVVKTNLPFGHIAFITAIIDNNTFEVAEANGRGVGDFRISNFTTDDPNIGCYLRR